MLNLFQRANDNLTIQQFIYMKHKLKIEIIGNKVSIFLLDKKGNIISKSIWIDNRDLSEKLLVKIDKLLKKNNITFSNIYKVDFGCDSPYYNQKEKKMLIDENILSKNKCGFTTWQIGEITAKVFNMFK